MKYVAGDEIMFDDEMYQITGITLRAKDNSKKIVLQQIVVPRTESDDINPNE